MMRSARSFALTMPALALYAAILATPLILMLALSFRVDAQGEGWTLAHYFEILGDSYFWSVYGRTLSMSLLVMVICVVLGIAQAYVIYRMNRRWQGLFLLIVLAPLLVAVVVRTLGWALLLGPAGPVVSVMTRLGWVEPNFTLLQSMTGVVIALVHVLVPFVVISVWTSLQRLEPDTLRAAASLGAGPWTLLRRLVLPQVVPGALSGAVVVFSLAATAFATPAIVGGRRFKVVATAAYEEFLSNMNWPLGSALAVLLLVVNIAIVVGINKVVVKRYAQVFES